jgi:pimeloyl-ACP methyl ester carboxylesterase
MPTLWVRGAESRELSRENYEKVLATNPLVQGVEIPNAGHWVHADQADLFTQALKDFVGGF